MNSVIERGMGRGQQQQQQRMSLRPESQQGCTWLTDGICYYSIVYKQRDENRKRTKRTILYYLIKNTSSIRQGFYFYFFLPRRRTYRHQRTPFPVHLAIFSCYARVHFVMELCTYLLLHYLRAQRRTWVCNKMLNNY